MKKTKRRKPSALPFYGAQIILMLSILFAGLTLFHSNYLYGLYAPFAGIIVLGFWVIIAIAITLALMWKQYRLAGQYLKAKAILLTLISTIIVLFSSLIFAMTGF